MLAETRNLRIQQVMQNKKRGGKPKGAQTFNSQDMAHLLELCEELLPYRSDLWDHVAQRYGERATDAGRKLRDSQFLEKKYRDLIKRAKPTSGRHQPETILWANRISNAIEQKVNMTTLDDTGSEYSIENDVGTAMEWSESESEAVGELEKENIQDMAAAEKDQLQPDDPVTRDSARNPQPRIFSTPKLIRKQPSVLRMRAPRETISTQSKQVLERLASSLERASDNSDLSDMMKQWERNGIIQSFDSQLKWANQRIERLEERNERLQEQNSVLKDENRDLKLKLLLSERFKDNIPASGAVTGH